MEHVRTWLFAITFALLFSSLAMANTRVFINEIDYDNEGVDRFEWIELAGQAGVSLDDYEILFIDQIGIVYNSLDLAAAQYVFSDETGTGWGFFVLGSVSPQLGDPADHAPNPWDRDQIQNGPSDSIQLRLRSGAGNVHLVDYEGDNTSTDEDEITLLPDSNIDLNRTLYKTGQGSTAMEFLFANAPGNATPGAINSGQTLAPPTSAVAAFESAEVASRLSSAPNPFREVTDVSFQLVRPATVEMAIFDPAGRRIRDWPRLTLEAGTHRQTWDGTDNLDRAVAPGVYLARLSVNGGASARGRIVLIR